MDLGSERGTPIHSSEPAISSPSGDKQSEEDGALGVPGGQPDVSPSGPHNNNELPEPKVKICIKLGTRLISAFASRVIFENKIIYIIVHINSIICMCSHHHTFTLQLCNFVFFIYFQYAPSWREVIHHSTL